MATFSVFAIGARQQTGTSNATHTVPMPAGTLTDKLLLIFATSRWVDSTVAVPSGYTRLTVDEARRIHVFGKIGTASESSASVAMTVPEASQAWCVAINPEAGRSWPAIGSVLVAETYNESIGSGAAIRHAAHTADAAGGNCLVSVGVKYGGLTGITITDVAASSGWDQAGFTTGPTTSSGFCTAAEVRQAPTTSSEAVAQRDRTITTWSATANNRDSLTLELAQAPAGITVTVDDDTIDPHPDTVVVIEKSEAWSGTVTATIEGAPITLTDIDTTHKSFTLDIDDLLPGGAWNAISPLTTATLAVTDDDGTYTTEVQIVFSPSTGEDYVASPGANIGTHLAVPGAVIGDPHFGFWHTGDGARDKTILGQIDAGTGDFQPISLPAQGRLIAYSESGSAWLDYVDTVLFSAPPTLTVSDDTVTPGQTITLTLVIA